MFEEDVEGNEFQYKGGEHMRTQKESGGTINKYVTVLCCQVAEPLWKLSATIEVE